MFEHRADNTKQSQSEWPDNCLLVVTLLTGAVYTGKTCLKMPIQSSAEVL